MPNHWRNVGVSREGDKWVAHSEYVCEAEGGTVYLSEVRFSTKRDAEECLRDVKTSFIIEEVEGNAT
jgi:hypothetical protein